MNKTEFIYEESSVNFYLVGGVFTAISTVFPPMILVLTVGWMSVPNGAFRAFDALDRLLMLATLDPSCA